MTAGIAGVTLAILACMALVGCEDTKPVPACAPFYRGQAVAAKGSHLQGIVGEVWPYQGQVWVYFPGFVDRAVMWCQDMVPLNPVTPE